MPKTETFKTDIPGVRSYITAAGKRYQCDWRDPKGGRPSKGGFRTKLEAKNYKSRMEGAKAEGRDTAISKLTYNDWWAKWWPGHKPTVSTGTARDYEDWHRLYIEPVLGDLRLVDIQPTDIKAMLAKMAANDLGVSTRGHAKRLASQVLKAAVPETPGMYFNPAADIKVGKTQKAERGSHALTPEQVEVIANACQPWLARTVRAIAYGGFRPSEACGLLRRHYDPATGVVTISEVLRDLDFMVERRETTKTFSGRRIKLRDELVAVDLVERAKGMLPTAPLYPGQRGGELRTRVLRKALHVVVRRLRAKGPNGEAPKLVGDNLPEKITPYTLRHTCATMLANAGVPVTQAAKYMGHDPVEFLRTYADVFDDDLDVAADAIAEAGRRARISAS